MTILDKAKDNSYIVEPRETDILTGRGGLSMHRPGNEFYRQLIRSTRPLYRASPKYTKLFMSKAIVQIIKNNAGRFLERSPQSDLWHEMSYKKALEKTSQALRERERRSGSVIRNTTRVEKNYPDLSGCVMETMNQLRAMEENNNNSQPQDIVCEKENNKKRSPKLEIDMLNNKLMTTNIDFVHSRQIYSPDLDALANVATAVLSQRQRLELAVKEGVESHLRASPEYVSISSKTEEIRNVIECASQNRKQLMDKVVLQNVASLFLQQRYFHLRKLISCQMVSSSLGTTPKSSAVALKMV